MSIWSGNVTTQDPKAMGRVEKAPEGVPMPIYMPPLDMQILTLGANHKVVNPHILTHPTVVDQIQGIIATLTVRHQWKRVRGKTH